MKLLNYDERYNPPAPILTIGITDGNTSLELPALIDPGSDQTLLPKSVLQGLTLNLCGSMAIQSATGVQIFQKYNATIVVDELPAIQLDIATFDFEEHAILGRDFLNQFKITLDGPNKLFSIE